MASARRSQEESQTSHGQSCPSRYVRCAIPSSDIAHGVARSVCENLASPSLPEEGHSFQASPCYSWERVNQPTPLQSVCDVWR
eukprot:3615787-Rhodomonas_salina.3